MTEISDPTQDRPVERLARPDAEEGARDMSPADMRFALVAGDPRFDIEVSGRLDAALAASRAPATRRAYRIAWKAWATWAALHRELELPANPDAVAAYLAARAEAGAGRATLDMARAAIAAAHDMAGEENPCAAAVVRLTLQGLHRQAAGRSVRQAAALDSQALAAIRATTGRHARTNPRAARDMALVSVMADTGLRITEAAASSGPTSPMNPTAAGASPSGARRPTRPARAPSSPSRPPPPAISAVCAGFGHRKTRPCSGSTRARSPSASLPSPKPPISATAGPAIAAASAWPCA